MKLIVGSEEKELEAQLTGDLLQALNLGEGKGLAIAVNDAVVPKSQWAVRELKDGDKIEIVRAVQGG